MHSHGQDISGANPNPARSFTDLDNIAGTIGKQSKVDETQLAPTRPETVPVKFQIPLKELAPGRYMCQINVIDEVDRKFAFPRVPLVVVP